MSQPYNEDPAIIVDLDDETVITWHSCGWGQSKPLVFLAEDAISRASTPMEVITNLTKAGFRVILTTVAGGTC
jgi:hypothetical protein